MPQVKQDIPVMARFLSDDLTDKDWKKMESSKVRKKKPLPKALKLLLLISLIAAFSVVALIVLSRFYKNNRTEQAPEEAGETAPAEAVVSENDLKARGTVIILDVDLSGKKIRFCDPESGEEYVLNTIGSTVYEDPAGNPMVMEQLNTGDIADILVSVHSSDLSYVKINKDSDLFEFRDITGYDMNLNKGVFTYEDKNYRILPGTIVMAGDSLSSFKDIKKGDVLTIAGKGKDLYTVKETGGNGYVRVTGAESFKGGWIELGNVIRPIDDEMLFTIPEGSYTMSVTYMHYGGTKQVTVTRGKETKVDVSDLKGDLLKTGVITFAFEPLEANPAVYIDGKMIVKESPLELDYGVHTLEVKAEGYVSIRKYLKVGQPMANLTIVLEEEKEDTPSVNRTEKEKDKDEDKDSEKSDPIPSETLKETFRTDKTDKDTSSEKDTTGKTGDEKEEDKEEEDGLETVTTDVNQLYIDGPEGAEVYFDGAYKGIAPCHFTKDGGTHVITLMKNGCETKSYTLNLSTGKENESYTFNELIEEHDA